MPRRRADADGTAPAPKPRQRKKKGEAAAEAAALAAAQQQPNDLDMPGTSVAGPGGMPFDPSMCGMGPGAHPSPASMLHRQNSVTGHFMPTDEPTGGPGGMYGGPGGPPGAYYLNHPGAHPGMVAPQPPPPYDMQSPHHPGSMSATPQAHTPGAHTPQPMQMPPPFGAPDPQQMPPGQVPPPGYGFAHPGQGGPGGAQQPPYNMRVAAPPPMSAMGMPLGYPLPPFFEYRIHEINRRIYEFARNKSQYTPESTKEWFDAFAQEFFMDKNDGNPGAEILIQYFDPQEQAPKRYKVGRPMIPRFFRSAFDNGVTEMFFECRAPPEEKYIQSYGRPYPSSYLECSDLLLVTRHDRPLPFEVHTECATRVEFGPYDPTHGCRIQRWTIEMRNCQEYFTLPKDQPISPELNDMIRRGVSRMGLPAATIWHLEMCAIMEPMQEIMSITKGAGNTMTPQKAMKAFMFQIHRQRQEQQMIMQQRAAAQAAAAAHAAHPMAMNHMGGLGPPPAAVGEAGGKQKAPRKRQRKSTASNGNGTTGTTTTTKKGKAAAQQSTSPTASGPGFPGSNVKSEFPSPSLQTNVLQFLPGQCPATDVLVVGEPSMMGSVEYGEEDERTISRIENTQYDPNSAGGGGAAQQQQNPMFGGGGGMPPHTSHGGTNPNSTPTSNAGMGTPQPGGMGMPPHGYSMNDFAMPQNVTEPSAMNNWAAQSMPVGASPSSRRY